MSSMIARRLTLAIAVLAANLVVAVRSGADELPSIARASDQNAPGNETGRSEEAAWLGADDRSATLLRRALRVAARRDGIPRSVIDAFIRINAYEIDLDVAAATTDSFTLLYRTSRNPSHKGAALLAGVLKIGGDTRKIYRFKASDGDIDYYDETGRSARTSLLRKPMSVGAFVSGFGMKTHPILGVSKMHTGVDWMAAIGTPIYASGDGAIEKIGWENGYGKYIRIRHARGFETAYAHLSRFGLRLVAGRHVRQGEIIGYVGSSGVSSGPHLHYEVLRDSRFVDPMRIRLPRVRVLSGEELSAFGRERDRLDAKLAGAPSHRLPADAAPK
jgi:murein DD-endopeptidase MepM/ murein hydrolase activator NlpD